ncbi:hypothetical protein GHK92_15025 [Nocardioides sp. dk4132]|uniref:hypothetical protein n=1 Tax=unclassified Nocardioides TaxID=2615069 RepID=UPI001294EEE6|nr:MULTISPECIES: hypothetical protein [unclassified Nocardioides]MQW77185.1 hypothetical protein [Nocardioides sp. dk4132]QGA07950.1 hypothetical protein GFH29_11505 [Nocardioides sp. dk884]
MNLDDLLARSAPMVTPRSPELDEDLRAMTRASGPRSRMRRPMRLTVAAGIAAGVLGLGTVGAAAVINNGVLWFTSTSSGDSCEMEFAVQPVGPEDAASGEPAMIMDGPDGLAQRLRAG